MKDHEYHALTDAFFQYVEDVIDEGYPDIDCERAGGVLTLSFENKTKVIINKQEPLHQIWVATRENGFHFELRGDSWIDNRFGDELKALLTRACTTQAGRAASVVAASSPQPARTNTAITHIILRTVFPRNTKGRDLITQK